MPDRSTPFDRVREQLGLSFKDFAEVLGCPFSGVYNAAKGYGGIPRRARVALAELGFDPEQLAGEQAAFLEERSQTKRAALKARLGVV